MAIMPSFRAMEGTDGGGSEGGKVDAGDEDVQTVRRFASARPKSWSFSFHKNCLSIFEG